MMKNGVRQGAKKNQGHNAALRNYAVENINTFGFTSILQFN